jgi:hypothetical protein
MSDCSFVTEMEVEVPHLLLPFDHCEIVGNCNVAARWAHICTLPTVRAPLHSLPTLQTLIFGTRGLSVPGLTTDS